ncbi:MAG TPA: hypothetical protein VFI22_07770 [Thermomicrobiales bacterium]|nr:hypothetical protein [Thermomicrobiales bacterium]
MGPQSTLWFAVAVIAAGFGLSLLYQRFIRRAAASVRSGGGPILFAIFMLIFAAGAAIAGFAAAGIGR